MEAAMQRSFLALAAAATAFALMGAADAFAGRRLAVGAAAGYEVPPGYEAVPVFNRSVGYAWTPADTSLGYAFREPIYATPKGYRYVYVRGYYLRRVVEHTRPVYKRVHIKKRSVKKTSVRRGPCVTDIGFGRHEYCN
jgi:hypothetical protein